MGVQVSHRWASIATPTKVKHAGSGTNAIKRKVMSRIILANINLDKWMPNKITIIANKHRVHNHERQFQIWPLETAFHEWSHEAIFRVMQGS